MGGLRERWFSDQLPNMGLCNARRSGFGSKRFGAGRLNMATENGLGVDLFQAMEEGKVKVVWINVDQSYALSFTGIRSSKPPHWKNVS